MLIAGGGCGQLVGQLLLRDVLRCGLLTISDHPLAAAGKGARTAAGPDCNKGEHHCK